jgi:hypothetical protein
MLISIKSGTKMVITYTSVPGGRRRKTSSLAEVCPPSAINPGFYTAGTLCPTGFHQELQSTRRKLGESIFTCRDQAESRTSERLPSVIFTSSVRVSFKRK